MRRKINPPTAMNWNKPSIASRRDSLRRSWKQERSRLNRSCGKRGATAAGLGRVGIDEVEALQHQGLFVIENHAVQIDERLRIDKDTDVVELVNPVALPGLGVEPNVIREPRAPSAGNAEAK